MLNAALVAIGLVSLVRWTMRAVPTPEALAALPTAAEGLSVAVYAQPVGVHLPTTLVFGPDGHLFVLTLNGDITRFEDQNGDGTAETQTWIWHGDAHGVRHAVGLTFIGDELILSDAGRISRLVDDDRDGRPDTLVPIVTDLPALRYPDHSNNGVVLGPDGRLYFGVGSTTDHGPVQDPLEASVLRVNADGSGLEVFARGFRNPFDLAFSPSGDLFTADNNPSVFDETLNFLAPEPVYHVRAGHRYGFPDAYRLGSAPADLEPPVTTFFPSVGSAGLAYLSAGDYPAPFQEGLFVALWGTGADIARDRGISNGQMVAFVDLSPTPDGTTYTGTWRAALSFSTTGNRRPVDVTVGPDHKVYVLEWQTGTVYRLDRGGTEPRAQESETAPVRDGIATPAGDVVSGEAIFRLGTDGVPACATCHQAEDQPGLGPTLHGIRERAASRVPALTAEAYIRQSILDPDAYLVAGYNAGYMYPAYGAELTDDQIDALVEYVLTLRADATP